MISLLLYFVVFHIVKKPNYNYKNTTRHTNEIIKQRIGCVPIHLKPDFPFTNYTIELSKNTGTGIIYATTGDFKILDKTSGNYVSEADTKKIFPQILYQTIIFHWLDYVMVQIIKVKKSN